MPKDRAHAGLGISWKDSEEGSVCARSNAKLDCPG